MKIDHKIRLEINDRIKIKKTGQRGVIRIFEGNPHKKVYVELSEKNENDYVYFRMPTIDGDIINIMLNCYDMSEIEEIPPWTT
jgi:hypothetical protein